MEPQKVEAIRAEYPMTKVQLGAGVLWGERRLVRSKITATNF